MTKHFRQNPVQKLEKVNLQHKHPPLKLLRPSASFNNKDDWVDLSAQ